MYTVQHMVLQIEATMANAEGYHQSTQRSCLPLISWVRLKYPEQQKEYLHSVLWFTKHFHITSVICCVILAANMKSRYPRKRYSPHFIDEETGLQEFMTFPRSVWLLQCNIYNIAYVSIEKHIRWESMSEKIKQITAFSMFYFKSSRKWMCLFKEI